MCEYCNGKPKLEKSFMSSLVRTWNGRWVEFFYDTTNMIEKFILKRVVSHCPMCGRDLKEKK